MEAEESTLIHRAQAGDQAAIEELDRRFRPELRRYANRRLGNDADADDVAQSALAKAMTRLHQFKTDTTHSNSFRGWLFQVTRSTIVDWTRKQQRQPQLVQDDLALSQHPQPENSAIEPTESCPLFAFARQRLTKLEYHVLWMKYVQRMEDQHIARAIRKTPGATRVMLTRIRKKLADYAEDPHA